MGGAPGAPLLVIRDTDGNIEDGAPELPSTCTLCRNTSRRESSAVGSRGCSLRVTTAEHISGSCQTESSRSGSGLCDEPKNLNDDVLAEAEDRPSVDSVVWRDPADRDGGGTEIVCVARGFDIDVSSC